MEKTNILICVIKLFNAFYRFTHFSSRIPHFPISFSPTQMELFISNLPPLRILLRYTRHFLENSNLVWWLFYTNTSYAYIVWGANILGTDPGASMWTERRTFYNIGTKLYDYIPLPNHTKIKRVEFKTGKGENKKGRKRKGWGGKGRDKSLACFPLVLSSASMFLSSARKSVVTKHVPLFPWIRNTPNGFCNAWVGACNFQKRAHGISLQTWWIGKKGFFYKGETFFLSFEACGVYKTSVDIFYI